MLASDIWYLRIFFNLQIFVSFSQSSSIESSSELFSKQKFEDLLREELNERNRQIFELLKSQIPSLLRAIQKSIAGKNLKTRQQCFVLLTHLLRYFFNYSLRVLWWHTLWYNTLKLILDILGSLRCENGVESRRLERSMHGLQ